LCRPFDRDIHFDIHEETQDKLFVFMGVVVLNAVLFLHQPFVAGISAGILFCWFFYVVVIGGRRQSEERFITKTAGGFFQGGVRYRATLLGIMIVFLLIHLPNKGLNKALGFQQRKFLDRTRSDFLDRMGKREGMMLITTEFNNISLKTRRPVLLRPGQLDTLIYAPESSLIMDRLLKKIYGVDLFNPPETAKVYKGEVRSLVYKTLWENRTLSEWQEIAREFQITDVLVPGGWCLQLPALEKKNFLEKWVALYTIPNQ